MVENGDLPGICPNINKPAVSNNAQMTVYFSSILGLLFEVGELYKNCNKIIRVKTSMYYK